MIWPSHCMSGLPIPAPGRCHSLHANPCNCPEEEAFSFLSGVTILRTGKVRALMVQSSFREEGGALPQSDIRSAELEEGASPEGLPAGAHAGHQAPWGPRPASPLPWIHWSASRVTEGGRSGSSVTCSLGSNGKEILQVMLTNKTRHLLSCQK